MSKKDKLFERLAKRPPPTDFRWDELITLMEQNEFTVSCSGGSHHTFQHRRGLTFSASKTHPSGILKPYQVKDALEAINKVRKSKP